MSMSKKNKDREVIEVTNKRQYEFAIDYVNVICGYSDLRPLKQEEIEYIDKLMVKINEYEKLNCLSQI